MVFSLVRFEVTFMQITEKSISDRIQINEMIEFLPHFLPLHNTGWNTTNFLSQITYFDHLFDFPNQTKLPLFKCEISIWEAKIRAISNVKSNFQNLRRPKKLYFNIFCDFLNQARFPRLKDEIFILEPESRHREQIKHLIEYYLSTNDRLVGTV